MLDTRVMNNLLLITATAIWLAYYAYPFVTNIRRARALGVPVIVAPVSPMNTLWVVFEPIIFAVLDRLPFDLFNLHYVRRGWYFGDKAETHRRLGDAFVLATPRETFLHVCDPDTVNDIFTRRQDFVRPVELYSRHTECAAKYMVDLGANTSPEMMNVFGHSVATVDPSEWKRHRKILAAPFNESTNQLVWDESLRQASDMLESWTSRGSKGTAGIARDTRTLSLDVLATAGFNKSYKFRASTEPSPDEARNYREALMVTLDNALLMMLVPPKILAMPFMPSSMRRVGKATNDFKQYMVEMLNNERSLLEAGKPGTGNLMSSLVRASEDEKLKHEYQSSIKPLTFSEILGNIYAINFAGHDTTANTLAFTMLLLAAYPEVQDWVREELAAVLPVNVQSQQWSYSDVYPRLTRCLAVLYETVRIYPPIMALPKLIDGQSTEVTVGGKKITVDRNIMVVPSILSVQVYDKFWGDDALEWRPSRWITAKTSSPGNEAADFLEPRKGTYLPWSEGVQNCPGKKFAHVEFAAVLARLLQGHRVRLANADPDDREGVKQEILKYCEDCDLGLLLRMKNADQVQLAWTPVAAGN